MDINSFTTKSILAVIIIAVSIAISALRHKMLFKIGLRNSYRRKGTTILILLGTLVGTVLITSSQLIGDSYDHTAEITVRDTLGEIDLIVDPGPVNLNKNTLSVLRQQIADTGETDSIDYINSYSVAIQKGDNGKLLNSVTLLSGDWKSLNKFGSDSSANLQIDEPKEGSLIIHQNVAKSVGVSEGDTLTVYLSGIPKKYIIEKIIQPKGVSGFRKEGTLGSVIINRKDFFQGVPAERQGFNTILVSAKGGVFPDSYDSGSFETKIQDVVYEIFPEGKLSETNFIAVTELKSSLKKQIKENGLDIMFTVLSGFGIIAGSLLIVNIFTMIAEERESELGIMRAVGIQRSDLVRAFIYEGSVYSLFSSAMGVVLGCGVGYLLITLISRLLSDLLSSFGVDARVFFAATPETLLLSFSLGFIITFVVVTVSSIYISRINIVSAIRQIAPEPLVKSRKRKALSTLFDAVLIISGTVLFSTAGRFSALTESTPTKGFFIYLGPLMAFWGASRVIFMLSERFVKLHLIPRVKRILNTVSSALVLSYSVYALYGKNFRDTLNETPAFFLVIGICLIVSTSILLTYNLDIIVYGVKLVLGRIRKLVAVVQVSVKYVADKPGRTTITVLTYAVILFIITLVGIYRYSFSLLIEQGKQNFLDGFDGVVLISDRNNTDTVIKELKDSAGIKLLSEGDSFSITLPDYENFAGDIPQDPGIRVRLQDNKNTDKYTDSATLIDNHFGDGINIEFDSLKDGLKPEKVWEELYNHPDEIFISGKFTGKTKFDIYPHISVGDKVQIQYPGQDKTFTKEVIAVGKFNPQNQGEQPTANLIISDKAIKSDGIIINNDFTHRLFFNFKEGINATDASNKIKENLATIGEFQVLVAEAELAVIQAFINQFLYLVQGFLALGLVVGLAGISIILVRSVNERRQQIGMLRSLGFNQNMVIAGFLIESTIVGIIGITVGIATGSVSGILLLKSALTETEGFTIGYPYTQIALLALGIYVATLLFSIYPSYKASRLEPVEATNYPE
ncbi:FtsX-like permease family protein [Candidatus Nomurabacteria bacterium]|nr:FtsX-like permease family protein [Candidatus Nomurabacteria bacterium]